MGLITGMGLSTWPLEFKITRVGAKIPQENLTPGGQAARRYFSPRGGGGGGGGGGGFKLPRGQYNLMH